MEQHDKVDGTVVVSATKHNLKKMSVASAALAAGFATIAAASTVLVRVLKNKEVKAMLLAPEESATIVASKEDPTPAPKAGPKPGPKTIKKTD